MSDDSQEPIKNLIINMTDLINLGSHFSSLWAFCLLRAASEEQELTESQRLEFLQPHQKSIYLNCRALNYLKDLHSIYMAEDIQNSITNYKLGKLNTRGFTELLLNRVAPNLEQLLASSQGEPLRQSLQANQKRYLNLAQYKPNQISSHHLALALIEDAWTARIQPFTCGTLQPTTCIDELFKTKLTKQDKLTLVSNTNPMDAYRIAWYLYDFRPEQFKKPDPKQFDQQKQSKHYISPIAITHKQLQPQASLVTSYITGQYKAEGLIQGLIEGLNNYEKPIMISQNNQDRKAAQKLDQESYDPKHYFISHPQNPASKVSSGWPPLILGAITGLTAPVPASLSLLTASIACQLQAPSYNASYNTEMNLGCFTAGLCSGLLTRGAFSIFNDLPEPDLRNTMDYQLKPE